MPPGFSGVRKNLTNRGSHDENAFAGSVSGKGGMSHSSFFCTKPKIFVTILLIWRCGSRGVYSRASRANIFQFNVIHFKIFAPLSFGIRYILTYLCE